MTSWGGCNIRKNWESFVKEKRDEGTVLECLRYFEEKAASGAPFATDGVGSRRRILRLESTE